VTTALVTTLTAEVRVLMVGNRQVTLSVHRQLDWVKDDEIEPFGRVHDKSQSDLWGSGYVFVVGRDVSTGALVKASRSKFPVVSLSQSDFDE
jgi:hypothetical protein